MKTLLAFIAFFQWDNFREFLAKHTVIGFSTSAGASAISLFMAINPILQFIGLSIGIFIAYLTAEAKLEERKLRRNKKPSIDPELIEDFKRKAEKAKNGKQQ